MFESIKNKTSEHLINLIKKRSGNIPNFSLFLGAGASASSGVKVSREMISELRIQLYHNTNPEVDFNTWLIDQYWYNHDKEYSILFEKVYDEKAQRRIYIEECLHDAKASWGYIYLSNIISHNYFNVVFTTNFDDLLNEACFIYANCKPIVCAQDSSVNDIRLTSLRPKIVKLHGDFLYDNIKNTFRETDTLEDNMKDKFIQFGKEYGLVVIGYGGYDNSIMDILNMMIKYDTYFPCGLYWCIKKNSKVSNNVLRLLQNDRAYLVEIDGFDEFMAELHNKLSIDLPDKIKDPYKSITNMLNDFIAPRIKQKRLEHPVIRHDADLLKKEIQKFENVVFDKRIEEFDRFVPYARLGDITFDDGDYIKAIQYYEKGMLQKKLDPIDLEKFATSYMVIDKWEKAQEIMLQIFNEYPDDVSYYFINARYNLYRENYDEALEYANQAIKYAKNKEDKSYAYIWISSLYNTNRDWTKGYETSILGVKEDDKELSHHINMASALKQMGKIDESHKIVKTIIDDLIKDEDYYNLACAYSILNDKERMLEFLKLSIDEDPLNKLDLKHDPDFIEYKDDPDFRKILTNNP